MSTDIIKPDVSEELARELLAKYYGIMPTKVKEVNSYDDRNFIISQEDGRRFILKVSNILESRDSFKIDFQNSIMTSLSAQQLPVQRPLETVNQRLVEYELIKTRLTTSGETGQRRHAVRLLSFIPGHILCDDQVRVDAKLLHEIGATIGRISSALTVVFKSSPVPSSDNFWSFMAVPKLREIIHGVREDSQRQLVTDAILMFENEVLPVVETLTQGVIHGDPNEQNILVRERTPQTFPPSFEVAGILDWQDTHRCPIIFDLAILCMYVLFCRNARWDSELTEMSSVRQCVEGFTSVWPLAESELRLLPTLIIARYAQSLCIGAYSYYELDPTNEYLLVTAAKGWRQFENLLSSERRELLRGWTGIMK